jgi:RHS repeat-associated protein
MAMSWRGPVLYFFRVGTLLFLACAVLGAMSAASALARRSTGFPLALAPLIPPAPVSDEKAAPGRLTSVKVGWLRGGSMPLASSRALRTALASPTAPFTECPAVGNDTSCGLLIDVTESGTVVLQDPSQGPFDGIEDTLVGVINQSSKTIGHLTLESNTIIFGFDGDGLCSVFGAPEGCPFGPTGYEGPGTGFTEVSPELTSGVVSFSEGVAPGGTAYFSLEEPLTASSVVSGGPGLTEQGGALNRSEHRTTCGAGDPVNCATGVFSHEFTDASIPGRGVPLKFSRTCSSLNAETDGPLGFGWTDSYNMSLAFNGETGAVTVHEEGGSTVSFFPNGSGGFTAPARVLATLVKNEDGSYTFSRYADHVQYIFSEAGQLLREVDRNGNTTTLSYSGGLLERVTDPSGRSLVFTYTGSHISTVTDPMGRTTTFSYDGQGNLASTSDSLGRSWSFAYDANHLLLSMTDPRGGVVSNIYDGMGRVTEQVDPVGRKMTWSFEGDPTTPEGGVTTMTDARGDVTVYYYSNLELRAITHGFGTPQEATSTYQYDPTTLGVTVATDPDGNVTRNTYDEHGNLTSAADPLGRTSYFYYNALDEVYYSYDPRGVATSYSYDEHGNLLEKSTPLNETGEVAHTTYSYEGEPGELTAISDPNGHSTKFAYDNAGDRTGLTDANGHTTSYSYNPDGQLTAKIRPSGHTTTYTYDAAGQLIGETDALGHTTSYSYDAEGNRITVTDANGHATQQSYNPDNELTQVTRPDGSTLKTEWDAAGNMTAQVDGTGHATTYAYDALNRLISTTDPDGHTTGYSYDAAGRRTAMIDAEGQTTYYGYDPAGELTGIFYSDGTTPSVNESYDANGNRIELSDGTGTSTFTYDALNRLTSATDGSGAAVHYSYDLAGRLTGLIYPNGKEVSRSYDNAGNLTSVTDWQGHTTHFAYNADSNLAEEQYPNAVTTQLSYDNVERLTSIADTGGGHTLASFSYTRDPVGQVTSETANNGETHTTNYARNTLDELTLAGETPYGYDDADNPTTFGNGTTQSFDPANQLVSRTTPVESTEPPHEEPPHEEPPHHEEPLHGGAGEIASEKGTTNLGAGNGTGGGGGAEGSRRGAPSSPSVDAAVHAAGHNKSKITSPKLHTHGTHDLVLAFIAASGRGSQRVTRISGDGLRWSPLVRNDGRQGAAEIWQANSGHRLNGPVTARLHVSGSAVATVVAFGNSAYVEAHASSHGQHSAPSSALAASEGALLWAVGHSTGQARPISPGPGQHLVTQLFDKHAHTGDWVQQTSAASSSAKIAGTQSSGHWGLATVVIAARHAQAARVRLSAGSRTLKASSTPNGSHGLVAAVGPSPSSSARPRTAGVVTQDFTYNARGDRAGETGPSSSQTLSYDQADRLTSIDSNIFYAYNGDGLRVSRTVNGATTQFAWNYAEALPELLVDGATYYIYGPEGKPIERITDETLAYLHQDQQDSTRLITEEDGNVVGRYEYTAWGAVSSHTGATSNLQYDGQYTDAETGFQYLRARYYDPSTGEFLTQDPVFPLSESRYGYSDNNPTHLSDPFGLWPGEGIVHGLLDTIATIPYGAYYISYNVAKAVNGAACSNKLGVARVVTCAVSHAAVVPLVPIEAWGLSGDVIIDQTKVDLGIVPPYYSVCDEGQNIPSLPRWLFHGGPTIHNAPGIRVNGGVDFEW